MCAGGGHTFPFKRVNRLPLPVQTSGSRRGIILVVLAGFSAGAFVIPWRVGASMLRAQEHSTAALVLVLLISAAVINTLASLPGLLKQRADRHHGHQQRYGFGRTAVAVSVALAILTLAGNLASAQAAALVSAPVLAMALRSQVLWVSILAWLMLREGLTRLQGLGMAMAALGLLLLNSNGPPAAPQPHTDAQQISNIAPSGLVWGILAALCFAAMLIILRRYREDINPLPVNAFRLVIAVGLWLLVWGAPDPKLFSLELIMLGSLAAFFGPVLSRTLMMYALRETTAPVAALTALITPVATVLFAWVILSETPTGIELMGGGIMLSGLALPVLGLWNRT